jgi:hypothetical protein
MALWLCEKLIQFHWLKELPMTNNSPKLLKIARIDTIVFSVMQCQSQTVFPFVRMTSNTNAAKESHAIVMATISGSHGNRAWFDVVDIVPDENHEKMAVSEMGH